MREPEQKWEKKKKKEWVTESETERESERGWHQKRKMCSDGKWGRKKKEEKNKRKKVE